MSASNNLSVALSSVNWNEHVQEFVLDSKTLDTVAACNLRISLWARQLELAYAAQPALSFVRALQVELHYSAALLALALYKPAASTMRAALESALYFVYFRNHPQELATLARDPRYYLSRKDIIEHLQLHESRFGVCEQALGLLGRLSTWYRAISAIVHGTVPGRWMTQTSLKDTKPDAPTRAEATSILTDCAQLIHDLFLSTVAQDAEIWHEFSPDSKVAILKGIAGPVKATLALAL